MDFTGFGGMQGGVSHPMGAVPMMQKLMRGVMRRNVDYSSSIITYLEDRLWQRGKKDRSIIQPDVSYATKMVAQVGSMENPVTAITTKFVKTVYNKQRCPIFCTAWAPDGRRLIAGAASGEFSLWNGVNLNFEALMKSHESSVRSMEWSHNGMWMATTDDRGVVKYWQSNMNNVHSFQAHNETIRGCSFSPTDAKLATCSDDGTVRVFDFLRSSEEFILRGHGADVKCVDWHPRKNLLVSGSKDNQQPIKLWDAKAGQSVSTIHAHKAAVTSVKWNRNGNWLLTASRDHLIKLYDIRTMKELEVLKGHKSDVNTVSWHPIHEKLFTSGGSEGAILFWLVGNKRDIGGMESPHDSFVWSLAWHPLGHMLCSGSNDHTCKFWCRNRPGDEMKDRHSSGGLPVEEIAESDQQYESGSMLHSGNISLPPPTKNLGSLAMGRNTWATGPSAVPSAPDQPGGNIPLQVLGADIIKEFGKTESTGPPPAPNQSSQQPASSGLFMHIRGGEGKEGGPPQPPGDFGPSLPSPQGFQPHQNPAHQPPGLGSPLMRGPAQNFQGPRPPPPQQHHPMQQQQHGRKDWGEGRPDFRPQFSPHELPPHRHFRPSGHLTSNPFSWQRQEPNRDRMNFEDESTRFNEAHNNPYVYRREEGRLRDPREQRGPPPQDGTSQDEGGPDWHARGPMGWRQEPHGGGGPPGHPREQEFHDRDRKPPTQEHFDQQQRSPEFGPPRDRNMEQFPPIGRPPHDRREGENWRPPFHPERPPHEGPQQQGFQRHPPLHQGPRFPHEEQRMPPQPEPHDTRPDHEKRGPLTPMGNVPLQLGGEERGGHVHDPRSQRPPFPPHSTPQQPPFPPHSAPQQRQSFPDGPPPDRQEVGPPNLRDGGLRSIQPVNEPPQPSPQVRDVPPEGPLPHMHEGPPNLREGPLNLREGPPNLREGPLNLREGPPNLREGPPNQRDGPPILHEGPPNPHKGPHPLPHTPHDGPAVPQQFPHGLPPPHNSPAHLPPHLRDGPPRMLPPNREGPTDIHNRLPHTLIHNAPDGPVQHLRDGGPPQHDMVRDGPPQHLHEGPAQHLRDGGPPQHDMVRDGPPQQVHDGPRDGPNMHKVHIPQQVQDGPPPHIHDGPPMNSPQHRNAPPNQRFDEFHGPPQRDQFFQNQPGGGPNSPHTADPPQQPRPPFMPPHSRPGPTVQAPPEGPQFPGPLQMGREQEHFHSPQHFPEPQGPPNMHRPPHQHYTGPPQSHMDQGRLRDPQQRSFNQFPPEQQHPPHHPGPSDPRRPPQNFPLPDRVPPPPNDRGFPPHPPHNQHHGPPHRQDGGPPPQQSGDTNWNQQRQFPRDSAGGRYEGNREPSYERRSSGSGGRGDGREGRDKREREREREGRGTRGPRDRSPKHHSSRDAQPPVKRSRSERDTSSKHRREKSSRK